MQTDQATLKAAYDSIELGRHGVTFEAAMRSEMFKTCLTHIAETLESIKQPPLPRHHCAPHWQDRD